MIEDDTYAFAMGKKGEHNLNIGMKSVDAGSSMEYAESVEKCTSDCPIDFKSGSFFSENELGVIVINADPEKYKTAVLDALSVYLDQTFALYAKVRNK